MPDMITRLLAVFVILAGSLLPALAVEPAEMLDDPVLEKRARTLSAGLRCLVCQNESIDASNADMARDLRLLVRERLVAGDSDDAVIDYLVSRYGEYVLLKPRLSAKTYVLWATPALVILIACGVLFAWSRTRRQASALSLSEEEQRRLEEILKRDNA